MSIVHSILINPHHRYIAFWAAMAGFVFCYRWLEERKLRQRA
ncbi:MAG TPA: hypothetical protein PK867_30115 [Pirellulales bacterium]|nr:hypothetical protein [Pirellulales bacterium]